MFIKNISTTSIRFTLLGIRYTIAPNETATFDDRFLLELKTIALALGNRVSFEMEDSAVIASATENKISKNVGPTYTTNAIVTLTQAEYDAILTKDASTLYFIV